MSLFGTDSVDGMTAEQAKKLLSFDYFEIDIQPVSKEHMQADTPPAESEKLSPEVPEEVNPYNFNQMLERGKNRPGLDLFAERTRKKNEIAETDEKTDELDLYSERLRKKPRVPNGSR